jgi:hypothetical protein
MAALPSNNIQGPPFLSQENSSLTGWTAPWVTYSHILLSNMHKEAVKAMEEILN